MPEVKYIHRDNTQILLIDLSNLSDARMLPDLVAGAIRLAQAADEPGALRTLVDLSKTKITKHIRASLQNLSRSNGRHAKATAFVGLNSVWSLVLSTLLRAGGKRNHKVIRTRGEALLWLEQQ